MGLESLAQVIVQHLSRVVLQSLLLSLLDPLREPFA